MNDLDPRTKMMMLICISAAAMLTDKILFLSGLLIFTLAVMFVVGVSVKQQKKQFTAALGLVVFLFILQVVFGQLYLGLLLSIRLLIIIMSAMILLTGQPRDYLLALVQCRMPYELAYMVILAFHFFPILKEEALDVYYSIQLRGTELQKTSISKKLSAYKKMCIPVLAGAMERAKDTSIAMEARGFRAYRERTYMRKLKLKKRDVVIIILIPVLAAAFVLFASHEKIDGVLGKQVVLSQTAPDTITVSWTDDEKYDGIVEYDGEEAKAEATEVRSGEYYRYAAELSGLEKGKNYKYCVGNGETMSKKSRISINGDDEFSFLYIGDIQYQLRDRDYGIWGELIKQAYSDNEDVSLGIFAGDMVEKGPDLKDWEAFFANSEPVFSQIPMMTTVGNHETSIIPSTYLKVMALPQNSPLPEEVYSFDYGGCHFVSLNSCLFMDERKSREGYETTVEEVNKWLKEDLEQSKAKWKIVYMHHPMYPLIEDDDIYGELRGNWEDIMIDGGVDMVLCGHQHAYMRTEPVKGITYIMANSGEKNNYYTDENTKLPEYIATFYNDGSNYLRVDVSNKKLEIEAYDNKGKIIDSYKTER